MLFLKLKTPLNQKEKGCAEERVQVWRGGDAQGTELQSSESDLGMTGGFITSLGDLGQVTTSLSSLPSSVK